jgi:predicted DsbA family dithiol-disulfide isomerase
MQKVKIEIWSDIVCPFCYIGKNKLFQAIDKLNAKEQIEVVWHSFQLDPSFPLGESVATSQYLSERKNISREQLEGMYDHIKANGKAYNIQFNFKNALTFNTHQAHKLWQWTKKFNKSSEMKEVLMYAYFTENRDLSKESELIELVEKIGLSKQEAILALESEEYTNIVQMDLYAAHQMDIRGVPFFLINEKAVISGAQDDRVFEQVLQTALQFSQKTSVLGNSDAICNSEGNCV